MERSGGNAELMRRRRRNDSRNRATWLELSLAVHGSILVMVIAPWRNLVKPSITATRCLTGPACLVPRTPAGAEFAAAERPHCVPVTLSDGGPSARTPVRPVCGRSDGDGSQTLRNDFGPPGSVPVLPHPEVERKRGRPTNLRSDSYLTNPQVRRRTMEDSARKGAVKAQEVKFRNAATSARVTSRSSTTSPNAATASPQVTPAKIARLPASESASKRVRLSAGCLAFSAMQIAGLNSSVSIYA